MTVLNFPRAPASVPAWQIPEPDQETLEALVQVQNHFDNVQENTPLPEGERFFLTRECMLRYVRACKLHPQDAIQRLTKTLEWRREWNIDGFTAEYISPEQETGKQLIYGFDNDGRPIWIMRPKLQNTEQSDRQLHHMVYFLEMAIALMPQGVETCSLLVNFAERSTGPTFSTSRRALDILQSHYPERLGRAHVIQLPWVVKGFFKLIGPFIDPKTRQKLVLEDTITDAPADQLEKAFGGTVDFGEYDHASYWENPETSITHLVSSRKDKMLENWKAAGGHIGISERVIKQGL